MLLLSRRIELYVRSRVYDDDGLLRLRVAPAADVIEYTTKIDRTNGTLMTSQYTGLPNSINNRAWEKLILRNDPYLQI